MVNTPMNRMELGTIPNLGNSALELRWRVLEQLIKFKGADWVGMIFGLISTYYLAKGKRAGFLFGVIGGFGWVTFGFLTGSIAGVLANLCFIAVNCHGYCRWTRKRNEKKSSETGTKKKGCSEEQPSNDMHQPEAI